MKPGQLWPIAIVGVLALTVGANAWILYEANRDPNGSALESDYYRKAVAWDSTAAQATRDSVLGWRLEAAAEPFDPAGTPIAVSLADRGGVPLGGARVTLVAIHNLDAGREIVANFVLDADGRAWARVPLHHTGLWELRFDARHGTDRFTRDLRVDVAAAAR